MADDARGVQCPICSQFYPKKKINVHVNKCIEGQSEQTTQSTPSGSADSPEPGLSPPQKRRKSESTLHLRSASTSSSPSSFGASGSTGTSAGTGISISTCTSSTPGLDSRRHLTTQSTEHKQTDGDADHLVHTVQTTTVSPETCEKALKSKSINWERWGSLAGGRVDRSSKGKPKGANTSITNKHNASSCTSSKPTDQQQISEGDANNRDRSATSAKNNMLQMDSSSKSNNSSMLHGQQPSPGSGTFLFKKRPGVQSSSNSISPPKTQVEAPLIFGKQTQVQGRKAFAPLAEQMRPLTLEDYVGQDKALGKDTMLRTLLRSQKIPSMILWGPPGCGKTTLARIIAQQTKTAHNTRFVQLSATTSGIADVKEVVKVAKNEQSLFKRRTILFVDEVHRFNKLQQDSFLPHVEDGTIILIGATTENPSFQVNNALLSRCKVVVLEKLGVESMEQILKRALLKLNIPTITGDGATHCASVCVEEAAVTYLAHLCDGDARVALNSLQTAIDSKQACTATDGQNAALIRVEDIREGLQRSSVQYDRAGEEHYNCASALQKSIRGSNDSAAIYWLARMVEGGEDPIFIARRLVVCASEDIGLADPQALVQAVSTFQACNFIGMPECAINLAQCVTYLARAAKSNESYAALNRARQSIKDHEGTLPGVPLHLRNAPTMLMKNLGYGKGYSHPYEGPVDQGYLPQELLGVNFFDSSSNV